MSTQYIIYNFRAKTQETGSC